MRRGLSLYNLVEAEKGGYRKGCNVSPDTSCLYYTVTFKLGKHIGHDMLTNLM